MPSIFPFMNFAPKAELRKSRDLHKTRDGVPFLEICALLMRRHYTLGEEIFNVVTTPGRLVQRPTIRSKDLILCVGRPPKDDKDGRKGIAKSQSDLEREIFRAFGRAIDVCSRSVVQLSSTAAASLAHAPWFHYRNGRRYGKPLPPRPDLARLEFCVNKSAAISRHKPLSARNWLRPSDPRLTLGFVLATPMSSRGRLVCVWSQGGFETLVWCRLVRTQCRDLLLDAIAGEHTSLGVALFSSPVASHPDTLQFAANVGVHAALVTVESPKHVRPLVRDAAAPSSAGVDPRQHGGGARSGRT